MKRFVRSIFGPVAGVLLLFAVSTRATDVGGLWTLAALAPDVDAAVFRDEAGALHTLAIGDPLPGDVWRLAAVRDGRAVLVPQRLLQGHRVEQPIAVGGRITLSVADDARGVESSRVTPETR